MWSQDLMFRARSSRKRPGFAAAAIMALGACASTAIFSALLVVGVPRSFPQERPLNQAPPGFTSLFSELAAKQAQSNAGRDMHWQVDAPKGEILSRWRCGTCLATPAARGEALTLSVGWVSAP
jgi:hypothetical protein